MSTDERVSTDEVARAVPDAPALLARTEALTGFVVAAEGVLPASRLAGARALAKRAGDRLRLSGEHTVVALAGATGSGKSSLFNALARMELSTVGVRRPTTAHTFACVWGSAGTTGLLDRLGVAPQRRFTRESPLDADDEAALRGLVLLDLPDFDSLAAEHRLEVDRILELVDLIVWVTDPQKYADQVLHDRYLGAFSRYGSVTVVVLNQADRLAPPDVQRCVADLAALLAAHGLAQAPVFAVSAEERGPGSGQLRAAVERAVADRQAALHRLAADLDDLAVELADVLNGPVGPDAVHPEQVDLLTDGLAAAAGVPAIVDAVGDAYRQRSRHALRRLRGAPRADPLAEVRAADPGAGQEPAQRAAVRAFTEPLAEQLPGPWATALTDAVKSGLAELPDRLRGIVTGTQLTSGNTAIWRVLGALRWLAVAAAVVGAGWLAARLTAHPPTGYLLPALLLGDGLVVGIGVTMLAGMLLDVGTRAARRRADQRLRAAVGTLAAQTLVEPVREVLARHLRARQALQAALAPAEAQAHNR